MRWHQVHHISLVQHFDLLGVLGVQLDRLPAVVLLDIPHHLHDAWCLVDGARCEHSCHHLHGLGAVHQVDGEALLRTGGSYVGQD